MNKRQRKKKHKQSVYPSKHWKSAVKYLKAVGWLPANSDGGCEALMRMVAQWGKTEDNK